MYSSAQFNINIILGFSLRISIKETVKRAIHLFIGSVYLGSNLCDKTNYVPWKGFATQIKANWYNKTLLYLNIYITIPKYVNVL
jgi:hypothetical protein